MRRISLSAVVLVLTTGCFHATIETGLPASAEVVRQPWAHGFVYGLVPPSTVEVTHKCADGVAKLETQLSFTNMVAAALTGGMYAPMQIDVTCARGPRMADPASAAHGTADRATQHASDAPRLVPTPELRSPGDGLATTTIAEHRP